MRIAFASSDGRNVDTHFGQADSFSLWEVGPDTAEMIGSVCLATQAPEAEDRILARAEALAGCIMVYTTEIGGPAAAKLVARRIQPIKLVETPIADAVEKLQGVLRHNPPPWLRKAISSDPRTNNPNG